MNRRGFLSFFALAPLASFTPLAPSFASGGLVKATAGSDSIMTVLSQCEYYVSPEVLKRYGPELLRALNSRCTTKDWSHGFSRKA